MSIKRLCSLQHRKAALIIAYLLVMLPATLRAEFALNFQPLTPGPGESIVNSLMDCNFSGTVSCTRNSSGTDPDPTPIFMETVRAASGSMYYHVIIGDEESDFIQEYYIQAGWGYWLGYNEFPQTASEGVTNGGADATPLTNGVTFASPLDSDPNISGNGTANPKKVLFRQIVTDTGFAQEVNKLLFFYKPVITQLVQDAEMTNNFNLDMSALNYDSDTTPGTMLNTLTIIDPLTNALYADFDIQNEAGAYISGGQYTLSGGVQFKGSMGVYDYADGDFDVYNVDWSAYLHPEQNVPDI